jgi:hydroxymethylbilane synthase
MSRQLKLGTRRSLLAWAQSSWVARQIERLNPGTTVMLVGIDTRGDKIQDVSLQKVEGKEFFVAELDDALKSKRVDLTVHSLKDLSLDRPREFALAAVPQRENPRDVILFGPRATERLEAGQVLKIGTSSPRRLENIPSFLSKALPGGNAKLQFVEIRGNVNTRLSRVHEAEGSERYLDGVVLAMAGIARLWMDTEKGRPELEKLLSGVRWMVMPLTECPAAPGQGALAIECRADDEDVRNALWKLHDPVTAAHVEAERELLKESGGGCHQRFGATSVGTRAIDSPLLFVRGVMGAERAVDEVRWFPPVKPSGSVKSWDGSEWRAKAGEAIRLEDGARMSDLEGKAVFVAHARAVEALGDLAGAALASSRVWTSGSASWLKLARLGVWVEGCAESLGYEDLRPTLDSPVLRLPRSDQWRVLTHDEALDGWNPDQVIATYRVPEAVAALGDARAVRDALASATHVFWSSGSQFEKLGSWAQASAHHACGPGKTAQFLRQQGHKPAVFPSVKEWRKWLSL